MSIAKAELRTGSHTFAGWYGHATYAPVGILSVCLVYMVGFQLEWGAAFLRWPLEVMYGESLIQDHAARLLRGEPLYQLFGNPAYSVAAYTPLFYALMALGQLVAGPGLAFGRIVSVLATAVTAALVGQIAARDGRGRVAGILAGLLFIAFGFPTPFPWFALAKEDSLGVAFGIASVAVLASGQTTRRVVSAGVLAALAILTKQTLLAAFVAGAVGLALCDRRQLGWFVAACLGPVAAVSVFFELTTHAFLLNTVLGNAQPFRTQVLLTNLATLKAYQAGPLAVAAVGIARRLLTRKSFENVLLPIYGLATLPPLLGLGIVGSAQNYWIELAAAAAVLAAAEMFWWLHSANTRLRLVAAALALLPLVNVVVAGRLALVWLPALAGYNDPEGARARFSSILEAVSSSEGPVVAEPLDALVLAGKPVLVEPWASDVLYQSGTWDIQPLVSQVCDGKVKLAVLSHPIDQETSAYHEYGLWPAPLLDAMRHKLVLQDTRAGRYLYVPLRAATCS